MWEKPAELRDIEAMISGVAAPTTFQAPPAATAAPVITTPAAPTVAVADVKPTATATAAAATGGVSPYTPPLSMRGFGA